MTRARPKIKRPAKRRQRGMQTEPIIDPRNPPSMFIKVFVDKAHNRIKTEFYYHKSADEKLKGRMLEVLMGDAALGAAEMSAVYVPGKVGQA